MTTTLPPTAARKPVSRTMTVEADPFGGGLVRLTVGGRATTYRTMMIPCDPVFGPFAVEMAKVADDHDAYEAPYHLTVSAASPAKAVIQCDCMGHERHGRCKHADCLRILLAQLGG